MRCQRPSGSGDNRVRLACSNATRGCEKRVLSQSLELIFVDKTLVVEPLAVLQQAWQRVTPCTLESLVLSLCKVMPQSNRVLHRVLVLRILLLLRMVLIWGPITAAGVRSGSRSARVSTGGSARAVVLSMVSALVTVVERWVSAVTITAGISRLSQKIRTSPFACGFMFVYIVRSWLWLLVPKLWLRILSLMFDYEALFARHVRGLRGSGYNVRNGQGR